MQFPFPVVVGDVGGTNARFALIAQPGGKPSQPTHRPTRDYPSLEAALADCLPNLPDQPRSAIICAAGPVEKRCLSMTNAPWQIDGEVVAKALNLDQGLLLNDFEAQALALPAIEQDWVKAIGDAPIKERGAQLILGPGTGLGAAALLEVDNKHFALSSEAGHIDFGPVGAEEAAIWPFISLVPHGRVSAETVLSGPGLLRLHNARAALDAGVSQAPDQPSLLAAAQRAPLGADADTIRLFWRLAARFAGDMTVAFLATGGVTFSGGVLPRLVDFLDDTSFRMRFEDKAPFDTLLRTVGTRIVMVDDEVLWGLGRLAAFPDEYAVNYRDRCWV